MKRYRYRAFREGGSPFSSVIAAESEKEAVLRLREKGCTVMRLREERRLIRRRPYRGAAALSLFCREWSALLAAGLPVTETLAVMEAQGKKAERAALAEAAEMIESGRTLSEAFASCGTFPPFFLSMLAVGELSGTLPEELSRLSQYYEKRAEFRRKLSEALAYPLFVFCFSAAVFLLVLTVVLPSFALLFEGLRIPLPPATEAALALGSFLREKGLLLLAGAGAMAAGLLLWLRTARGKDAADRLFMKSAFIRRILLIRFCYSLSSLLSAGRPLSEALADTAKASENGEMRRRTEKLAAVLARGGGFTDALREAGLGEALLLRMASAGMESGTLPEFLGEAARLMEERTERTLLRLRAVLGPVFLLATGAVAGSLVFAVMIPIFTAVGKGF